MERDKIVQILLIVFRKIFANKTLVISDEMTSNDVNGWDSLSHMLLISEIEREFAIKFKLKELNKMHNVGDMIDIIMSQLLV
jgi:acyl carrier protein